MKTAISYLKQMLLIALLIFTCQNLWAQKRIDVVQLKNGNVLKGIIVRQVPGDYLEIKTLDKNFWKFDMEDIAEIRSENQRRKRTFQNDSLIRSSKLTYELKMGALIGSKSNENNSAPFSMLGGIQYHWNDHFSSGVGTGLEALEETQIPVYVELKYYHKLNRVHTFIFGQAGYSFPLENRDGFSYYSEDINAKGAWFINPGLGIMLNGFGNTSFSISMGYRYQKNKLKWYNSYTDDTEYLREKMNRFSLHLGIIF